MVKKRLTRAESKQQTRKQLLQVATKAFAEHGFHGASVEKIAEEAGFSKGAVYSNFGSKEDLFLAVFAEQQKDDVHTLKQIAKQSASLDDFVHLIDQNHKQEREKDDVWSLLKIEFLLYAMRDESTYEKLSLLLEATRKQSEDMLKHFFQLQTNQKPSLSYKKLAILLLALDIGIGIQHFADKGSIPESVFADALKRLLNG